LKDCLSGDIQQYCNDLGLYPVRLDNVINVVINGHCAVKTINDNQMTINSNIKQRERKISNEIS
jgi:hypothetical protein